MKLVLIAFSEFAIKPQPQLDTITNWIEITRKVEVEQAKPSIAG
jgi:hypothetical protein